MRPVFLVLLILACFCALFLCCYAPALFQDRQFGYRDAGHFYYPLHARVQQEWNAGRWPLWELEENGGMPLLGNPTAAVLYPGKIVFAALPYKWAARIYIVAHSVLAFAAMLVLMRSWGVSWTGSGISALSYTFGGPILFQYCNIIYLVGAAWLPLGVHAVDRWVRLGRRWAILELAIVLGMQVLGGDPQTAFLLGIAGLGYAIGLDKARKHTDQPRVPAEDASLAPRRSRSFQMLTVAAALIAMWFIGTVMLGTTFPKFRPAHDGPPIPPLPWISGMYLSVMLAWLAARAWFLYRWRGRPWRIPLGAMSFGLAVSALFATAATSAQFIPVVEFTQQTLRASHAGTHELYAFSIEPHRLVELFWPNLWGTQFGENTFWAPLIHLPGSFPKIWVPSLYLGGFTIILALSGLTFRRGPRWRVWLSVVVVVSILGALGEYTSPIWLTRAIASASKSEAAAELMAQLGPLDKRDSGVLRLDGFLRDGDGSIYWLLAAFLPGFRQFRFPAKLFTFTALGLAALAGVGWDRQVAGRKRRVITLASITLGVSVFALAGVLFERHLIMKVLQDVSTNSSIGPFDAAGAFRAIVQCLAQASVTLALGLFSLFLVPRRPALASAFVLLLVSCDLAAANTRLVYTVRQSLFEAKPEVLEFIEAEERARPSPGPYRIHRMAAWNPPGWGKTPSADRVSDFVTWERGTIQPKYGIDLGVQYTHTVGVAELYDLEWFFSPFPRPVRDPATAQSLGIKPGDKVVYYPRRGFDIWNTRYFILPCFPNGWLDEQRATAAFLDETRAVYPKDDQFDGPGGADKRMEWIYTKDYRIQRNLQEFPRAWVVHQVRAVQRPVGLSRESRNAAIEEMLYPNDRFWHDVEKVSFDARQIAWVASDDILEVGPKVSGRSATKSEKVEVTYPSSQQAVLEVDLESPGLVVLADINYPGWRLTIDDQPAKIYRVNQLMRGALVPAKHHTLVYTFDPLSFRAGLVVSIMGLAGLLLFGIFCTLRPVDPLLAAAAERDPPTGESGNVLER